MDKIKELIFKKYDIRGKYPEEVNEKVFFHIGKAFVKQMKVKEVVVGRDMRISSESLFKSLASGINSAGGKVIDIGLCSTPAFYFAVCRLEAVDEYHICPKSSNFGSFFRNCFANIYNIISKISKKSPQNLKIYAEKSIHQQPPLAGLMITASHLGKNFNGLKLVGKNAVALSEEDMEKLKKNILCHPELVSGSRDCRVGSTLLAMTTKYNIKKDYISALRKFIKTPISKIKIVLDAGGGMASLYIKDIFSEIKNIKPIYLFDELDSDFSGRDSNPKEKKNRESLKKKILKEKANLGIMWDGDADRVYFLDNKGKVINPNFVSAFILEYLASVIPAKAGIQSFVADIRSSKVIADTVARIGAKLFIAPAWHTEIKKEVIKQKACFGSETSGHYIFKDFCNIDDGILAALIFLQAISEMNQELRIKNQGFIKRLETFRRKYCILEETNFKIKDKKEAENILNKIEIKYKKEAIKIIKIDGLTMEFNAWRFNLRQSLSEPLLRLNMEADVEKVMQDKFKELKKLI